MIVRSNISVINCNYKMTFERQVFSSFFIPTFQRHHKAKYFAIQITLPRQNGQSFKGNKGTF